MANLLRLIALVALPDYNLAQGAAVQILLPPTEPGGTDPITVIDNLLMGSLRPHCRAMVNPRRNSEVDLVAESACACFGRAVDPEQVAAELRLAGRQTDAQKLAFGEALRTGALHGLLAHDMPVEANDFADAAPVGEDPDAIYALAEGEDAYAIYSAATDGKSLVSGDPLPAWQDLSEAIRAAWVAAAAAILAVEDQPSGQIGYDAYVAAAGGKSLVSGDPLPAWQDLSEPIRAAWDAVAADLVTVVIDPESGALQP